MSKKITIWWMILLLAMPITGTWTPAVQAAYIFSGGGDGSPEDPYIILTAEDMNRVRDKLEASYRLGADIDLSGIANWVPIGKEVAGAFFAGNFDGNFHTVRGLTIDSAAEYVGLFGLVSALNLATPQLIKNVRLENVHIQSSNVYANVGGFAGAVADHTPIEGIYVSGSIEGSGFVAGGIAGQARNQVSFSEAHVDISGSHRFGGGLIGGTGGGNTINQSYATGDIHLAGGQSAGGLVGDISGTIITNSYALGNVSLSGIGGSVGGLIGNADNATITESYASGNVQASIAGGIIGQLDSFSAPPSLNRVYWNGTNPGLYAVGGGSSRIGAVDDAGNLKLWSTYSGWDTNTWGIREGASTPYLKRFAPEISIEALLSSPVTSATDPQIQVSAAIRDGSIGEPLEMELVIKNEANETVVAPPVYTLYASGVSQPFWSLTFNERDYPAGSYSLLITAKDTVAANERTRSFLFDIRDVTPPAVPSLTAPAAGASLNGATPTLSGTAEPLSAVTIVVNGADAATVTAAANGAWSWTATPALSEGSHTVAVRARDAAGNESAATDSRTFTVDMQPPVITLHGAAILTITEGEAFVDPGASAQDSMDGALPVTVTGHVDRHAPGTYELTYGAQDNAGNAATEVKRTVHVHARPYSGPYPSDEAELGTLKIVVNGKELPLHPLFTAETTRYQLDTVADEISLQAAPAHVSATVALASGPPPTSGGWTLPLAEGNNVFELKVTAESGVVNIYQITVIRHPRDESQPTASEPKQCIFRDMSGHWAEKSVCEAAELGIVKGESDGMFYPQREITRIEFAAMLLRTRGSARAAGNTEPRLAFIDADEIPSWAQNIAIEAIEAGVLQGYPDGTLRPLQTVNRAEMAAMIARAWSLDPDGEASTLFADDAQIPYWAKAYIHTVAGHGLLFGRGGHLFVPNGLATRAEAAVVLLRLRRAFP